MSRNKVTIDGNEAVAHVAYRTNEVIAIYPITPSSPMGEWSDTWSSMKINNIWGTVPSVIEMQSEGGAAGAVHGALQTGSLSTTFTASQGLLLMIPNMYKIAGELTSTVFHVAARTLATHALSIFGDHSDVMSVRSTGFAMVPSNSVQEAMDFALICQSATLEARVPFLHFFDGFRTSHEVQKIEELSDDDIRSMIDNDLVMAHRKRGLTPDNPVIRGTSQNPDVYFQSREAVNTYYDNVPEIVQKHMDKFADLTGRKYQLFDYYGHPEAERIIIIMGSAAETVLETVDYLVAKGEKIGVLRVRLYRPFSLVHFMKSLPASVKSIAVLDRTKEPGAIGEPLYTDVLAAFGEGMSGGLLPMKAMPRIIGGRYGLSSKEFTPAMIKAVFDELKKDKPKNHFTVGIHDDVTHTSLEYDADFITEGEDVFRGMFFGLGSDGTVGANKNSIKIIGENTEFNAQGYFVYDSKKAGTYTTSHLRFGKKPIHSTYLVNKANFIACHQFVFLDNLDMLRYAQKGATFLLNAQYPADQVWSHLNRDVQKSILDKELKFYVIDAYQVAKAVGMGSRINTIMQTCFFAISGVLPKEDAINEIKKAIQKTYGKKGDEVVRKNYDAVNQTLENLHEVQYPRELTSQTGRISRVPNQASDFIKNVTARLIAGYGDDLPVSAFPQDGTYPMGTTRYEKRNLAHEIPVWEPELCTQCGKCTLMCPHTVIRIKAYEKKELAAAPATFKHMKARGEYFTDDHVYTIQVAPEDCTGCEICVEVCPGKDKQNPERKALTMSPQRPLLDEEIKNWDFFLSLSEADRTRIKKDTVKGSQYLQPLMEFSGACSGCGETPYIKLATQLFGDRMVIGNSTGCSSIYGGNLPTTPYTTNSDGRGPAWSNPLFEDTAEFALGFRLTIDKHAEQAREMLKRMSGQLGDSLVGELLQADQSSELGIIEQRRRVEVLRKKLAEIKQADARLLESLADYLVKKSVWSIGGDGWAYDIGYGGLDHVLASGKDVNLLVMDTEVYSNTGGQMSKATPIGAVAKFAEGGKSIGKKDLSLQAIAYGNVYVAKVAFGANDMQTVKAFMEADAFPGTSIIIAYSHCTAHGYNMRFGPNQQDLAVETGYWPIFRYNPALLGTDKPAFRLDCKAPNRDLKEYMYNETRFKMLQKLHPADADKYMQIAKHDIQEKWRYLENFENYSKSKVVAK